MKTGYKESKKVSKKGYAMMADALYEPKPHLDVTDKDVSDLKNWKVGDTYKLEVTVKMTSLSTNEYNGEKTVRACFDVESVEKDGDD